MFLKNFLLFNDTGMRVEVIILSKKYVFFTFFEPSTNVLF